MIATLPAALSRAIEAEISSLPQAAVRAAAEDLSRAYRGKTAIRQALSPADRAAYLAVRFPSTFAAANEVWRELARVYPATDIRTVLDFGAGPGTASLATTAVLESGTRYTLLERDRGWSETAGRLARTLGLDAEFRHGAIGSTDRHDAVVACYALGELAPADRGGAVDALWNSAAMALVVIEPGTPRGFEAVHDARKQILALGGHAAAPCGHDAACPMSASDWCHRPVRVARSALHRGAKQASLAFEDEKFSYVVLTREPVAARPARIVRKPIRAKGHVHLDVCTPAGLSRVTVARSDGGAYRAARDASWGGVWPPGES
jgi:ribosomal protein RSM22 (predicted rRNA methylase)